MQHGTFGARGNGVGEDIEGGDELDRTYNCTAWVSTGGLAARPTNGRRERGERGERGGWDRHKRVEQAVPPPHLLSEGAPPVEGLGEGIGGEEKGGGRGGGKRSRRK